MKMLSYFPEVKEKLLLMSRPGNYLNTFLLIINFYYRLSIFNGNKNTEYLKSFLSSTRLGTLSQYVPGYVQDCTSQEKMLIWLE